MKKYRLVEIQQDRETVLLETDDLRDAELGAGDAGTQNPGAQHVIKEWDGIAYQPIKGVGPAVMTC